MAAAVLGEIGVRLPATTGRAVMTLMWQRFLVRLRGLRWRERDAGQIPAWDLDRVDTMWTMGRALSVTRPLLSSVLSWRALFRETLPRYQASTLPHIPYARCEWLFLEGGLALADGGADAASVATTAARRLIRSRQPYAVPRAMILRAALARHGGDEAGSLELLTEAEIRLEASETRLLAAVVRRTRGSLQGGEAGRGLEEEADGWLIDRGVREPARLAAALLPGLV